MLSWSIASLKAIVHITRDNINCVIVYSDTFSPFTTLKNTIRGLNVVQYTDPRLRVPYYEPFVHTQMF